MNHHSPSDASGVLLGGVQRALRGYPHGDPPSATVSQSPDAYQVVVEYTREGFFSRINADNAALRSIPHWKVDAASVDAPTYTVTLTYSQLSDGAPDAGVQAALPVVVRKSRKTP